jgi:tetratricopeptide (TPR) repeat protein
MGRAFWDAAVASLGDGALPRLDAALGRELVFGQVPAAFTGTEEYRFVHALLRDVAYETVLLADRPLLHARAAAWLDQRVGARRGEYLTVLADHHRLAGDLVAAADCLAQAGAAAMRVGQLRAAAASIDAALALWDEAGVAAPAAAETSAAEVNLTLGAFDAVERAATRARSRAVAEGDCAALADAIRCAATLAAQRGEHDQCLQLLHEAMSVAEQVGGGPLVRVLAKMVISLVDRGELGEAMAMARRALMVAEDDGDPALRAQALDVVAIAAAEQGDLDAAQHHLEVALEVARDVGDLARVVELEHNLGVVHHLRGDGLDDADEHRRARAHYETARELAVRLDRRAMNVGALVNLAQLAARLGEPLATMDLARQGLEGAIAIGAVPDILFALHCRAEGLVLLGRTDEALALFAMLRRHPAMVAVGHREMDRAMHRLGLDPSRLDSAPLLTYEAAIAACLDDLPAPPA